MKLLREGENTRVSKILETAGDVPECRGEFRSGKNKVLSPFF